MELPGDFSANIDKKIGLGFKPKESVKEMRAKIALLINKNRKKQVTFVSCTNDNRFGKVKSYVFRGRSHSP